MTSFLRRQQKPPKVRPEMIQKPIEQQIAETIVAGRKQFEMASASIAALAVHGMILELEEILRSNPSDLYGTLDVVRNYVKKAREDYDKYQVQLAGEVCTKKDRRSST